MTTRTKIVIPLFKILVNHNPPHGGTGKYPPLGRWTKPVTPSVCSHGYHLTSDPLRWWRPNSQLFLAEPKGPVSGDGKDKGAFKSVRLLQRITKDWQYLQMFPRIRAFLAAVERSNNPKADITWANLSWVDLSGANLFWANLSRANLSRANLSWANLSGADLSGVELSRANLSGVILPAGFKPT